MVKVEQEEAVMEVVATTVVEIGMLDLYPRSQLLIDIFYNFMT